MSWQTEFDPSWAVPEEILKAEGLEDVSWHNDACPSFRHVIAAVPDDRLEVRIWVDHSDPDYLNAFHPGKRFAVTALPDTSPWEGHPVPEWLNSIERDDEGFLTNDVNDALQRLAVLCGDFYTRARKEDS